MIYIIGFMGSGKSTIGYKLAKQLNRPFTDTDQEIEKQEESSIKTIFNSHGEKYFRSLEREILHQINNNHVVSCGGGLPLFNENMKYIKNKGTSIYLEASCSFLTSRLINNRKERPIINKLKKTELNRFIKHELARRETTYNQATYKINIEGEDTKEILKKIN